jgi:hypothetical protein
LSFYATKAEQREAGTSVFTLWNYGAHFLGAAQKLGTDRLPALYLACHATELALKCICVRMGIR